MKKLLFAGVAMLSALNGWAVVQQTYSDPSALPENFEWTMVRYDYRGTELVNTQDDIVVKWERDKYWTSTATNPHVDHYGKLTIYGFYRTECTKVESVTAEFENRYNRNFQWNESDSTIVFSFTAFNWSTSKDTSPYTSYAGYKSGHKTAFISALIDGGGNPMSWWEDGATSPVAYGNGQARDCIIDLKNKTITISNKWGCIMMTSTSGGSSTLVEYFERSVFREPDPTPLAEIEQNGVVNKNYIVADQLVGVYAKGGSLWCKDQGNVSIEKSTNPGNPDYMRGLISSMYGDTPEWDQSNWVELDFGTVTNARAEQIQATYVGQTIKAGSVRGKYVDNLNHRIVLSADPVADGDLEYIPNYYCPVNFMGQTQVNTDSGTPYYFLNPKSQEYAMVTMAVWNGNDVFVVPAKDIAQGVNTAGFSGSFTVDWGLNILAKDEVIGNLRTDRAYKFQAILRRNQVQTPSDAPLSDIVDVTGQYVTPNPKYVVCPLDLRDTSVITAITDVRSEREAVGDGYYYNLAGQRVTNPGPGFYIHNGKKVIVR